VGATTVIALALVPALRLMRDSVRAVGNLETSNLLATLCASKLEEHLQSTAVSWTPGTVVGDFAAQGQPRFRFQVVHSDNAADGGIPNALMSITATAWDDSDGDGALDGGERRVTFASKLARVVSYQREANGT
jgi:hypothetical protein